MKTLTQKQQEIISQIEKEFSFVNEQQVNGCDDIFAFIDSAVNEKQQYADDVKRNNAIFEKVIQEKAECIVERMNDVLERYGFECIIDYSSEWRGELIEYYRLKIIFNGFNDDYRKTIYKNIYVYTNRDDKDSIVSYVDSDVCIYEKWQRTNKILDNDLEKYVASLIIEKLKSKIN